MKWNGFHRDVLYIYSFDAVDHKSDKASQFYNSNFSIIQACLELQLDINRSELVKFVKKVQANARFPSINRKPNIFRNK